MPHRDDIRHRTGPAGQRGAALLVLALVLVLMTSTVFALYGDRLSARHRVDQVTRNALFEAKRALIAYAATSYETEPGWYGVLPCPDYAGGGAMLEGEQDGDCGGAVPGANALGRLPWRTLDLGPITDAYGECLWYAVSGPYKDSPDPNGLNADAPGLLDLYESDGATRVIGNQPNDRVVAAVFAPGRAIAGQDRLTGSVPADVPNCGGVYRPQEYLESVGIADNSLFDGIAYGVDEIAQTDYRENPQINDRVIYITRREIWDTVRRRSDFQTNINAMVEQVAECIAEFGRQVWSSDGEERLPWAAPLNPLGGGGAYLDPINYNDAPGTLAGRVPLTIDDSKAATGGDYPADALDNALFQAGQPACEPLVNDPGRVGLWNNWKDHIFYAVSGAADLGNDPPPADVTCGGAVACLSVDFAPYLGVVIFAGKADGQVRTALPDADTKFIPGVYLENGNDNALQDPNGTGAFTTAGVNDVIYCIDDDLNVLQCP